MPCSIWKPFRELAGSKHYLPVLAFDQVSVNIHVIELVIGAYPLKLTKRVTQRTPIPEADIGDGVAILCERLSAEYARARVTALDDVGESEGLTSEGDVVP